MTPANSAVRRMRLDPRNEHRLIKDITIAYENGPASPLLTPIVIGVHYGTIAGDDVVLLTGRADGLRRGSRMKGDAIERRRVSMPEKWHGQEGWMLLLLLLLDG